MIGDLVTAWVLRLLAGAVSYSWARGVCQAPGSTRRLIAVELELEALDLEQPGRRFADA